MSMSEQHENHRDRVFGTHTQLSEREPHALTLGEVQRIVNRWIGVEGGYLGVWGAFIQFQAPDLRFVRPRERASSVP